MKPNPKILEDLAGKLGDIFRNSPAHDLERNLRAGLTSMLGKLDLVTREEFDVQQEVLLRTREKLNALEARLAELEALQRSGAAHQVEPEG